MKKIFTLLSVLLFAVAVHAQKYLEVYRGGNVIGSMMATDVDSVRVTGDNASSRQIHFFAAGMHKAFKVNAIDSIKVNRTGDDPFVYLGIVGFNQALYDMPIDILATSTSSRYSSFVNNLARKDGTLLYYSVEHALQLLEQYNFGTPLTSVNLITFTDGLDQGSLMLNSAYLTDGEYLSALNRRIGSAVVRGIPVTAYSLGLRGSDVSDYTQFQNNLKLLATDENKALEVNSMYDVQSRLQEIAEQIISISHRQNISATIPGTSNGTRIRFTFDGSSPEYSEMYIEGILNLADRSLRNVTYHGIRSTSGTVVKGVQDGIFITFTFSNLYRIDGNGLIPTNYIRQYNQSPSSTTWQRNSEFTPDNNTQTNVAHSGAAIMLVLDCSSSLGSQFSNMQSYARDFISRVAQNAVAFNLLAPENPLAELELKDDHFIINLQWDEVKYAESYTIYRNNSQIAKDIISTVWTDTLPATYNNYYTIKAVGHGTSSPQSNKTESISIVGTPTNVTAEMCDDEFAINVNWDPVKYAETYTVYRNGTEIATGIEKNFWKDDSPLIGSNYYCVRAVGHGLTSYISSNSPTVTCALSAPTNVTAALDDNILVVHINWDAVKYAESYTIKRWEKYDENFFGEKTIASGITSTSFIDESPFSGTSSYSVIAEGHGMTSKSGSSLDVTCSLSAPTNVTATLDDDSLVIHINWDAVKYAESYSIYGRGYQLAKGVKSTSWTDESPDLGNNAYIVTAESHGIESGFSDYSETINCSIAAPQNVTATLDDNDLVIHVKWDAVKYAESYTIYRNGSEIATGITTNSWTDETPRSGNNYYSVKAVGHGMTSSSSDNSPSISCSIAAPTNVKATLSADEKSVIVSWDAVKYAESYTVYRSNNESSGFTIVAEGVTSTSWSETPASYGFFYYKVCAVGHGLTSAVSEVSDLVSYNHYEYQNLTNGIRFNINGVQFTMIKVEGGTFQMGSTSGDSDELPVHQVTLTNDYYIGETEVTQELWTAVMGSNPSYFKSSNQLPVEFVSWNACQTFITKLNALTGRTFRLPTEAEWEFAARGGNASESYTYSGSNNIGDVAWYSGNSSKTHDVATKAPNELGIYDMSGNVWEWCHDWYGSYSSEVQTNPTGPSSGSARVNRGGGWYSRAGDWRTANRNLNGASAVSYDLGLRLAL